MSAAAVMVPIKLSPQEVAAMFWRLDSVQMADFFAELERIAGVNLCFQMAWVVDEISQRGMRGETAAMNGFRTMFAHASDYAMTATELRCYDAKREIGRMVKAALSATGDA